MTLTLNLKISKHSDAYGRKDMLVNGRYIGWLNENTKEYTHVPSLDTSTLLKLSHVMNDKGLRFVRGIKMRMVGGVN